MDWTILLSYGRRKFRNNFLILIAWALICFFKISKAQDFKIDNQLRIQVNDCYTRIAIGSRMPDNAVISTVTANLLSDCEAVCSANRTICNAFSFGIDARGNGTCRIGRIDLKIRGNDLIMDPDYDVYERRIKMLHGCQHDRLLRIGFGARTQFVNSGNVDNTIFNRQQINSQGNDQSMIMINETRRKRPQNPFGNLFTTRIMTGNNISREPSFFRGGWYSPIADDSDSRLYDIINNKKTFNHWKQTNQRDELPHDHYPDYHHSELHSNIEIHEGDLNKNNIYRSTPFETFGIDNKWRSHLPRANKWTEEIPDLNSKWTEGIPELNPKWREVGSGSDLKWTEVVPASNNKWNDGSGNFESTWNLGFYETDESHRGKLYSTSTIPPGFGTRNLFHQGIALGLPSGLTVDSVLEKTKPCYRKLLAGKRLAESHVRRNVQCNRIEECHRMCEYENTFVCEGFNYGQMRNSEGVGRHGDRSYMCQLTSLSGDRMNFRRDFIQDPRYDYYKRDWRCPAEKPVQISSDWSSEPRKPLWHPSPLSPPSRRLPNEISRPLQRPNERYPNPVAPETKTYNYLPEKMRPSIDQPNERYPNPIVPDTKTYRYLPTNLRPSINRHNERYPYPVAPDTNTYRYLPENSRPSINRPNDYDYYSGASIFFSQKPRNDVIRYNRPSKLPQAPSYLPDTNYYYTAVDSSRPGAFSKFPDRRYDRNSWQRPQQVSRPNDVVSDGDWQRPTGQYLPNKDWPDSDVYGPSYGYHDNRYDGRQPSARPEDFYPAYDKTRSSKPSKRPVDQKNYYEYHYGPAYGYKMNRQHADRIDSYLPSWKNQHRMQQWIGSSSWDASRDCSVRSVTGFKVARNIVDASYTTGNLEECEMLCASRDNCQSFSYRYSLAATAPTDNCLLSNVNFSKLHFYTDLVPDRDYDIYAIISDLRNCQGSRKHSNEGQPHHRPSEECFWRVRSGFEMPLSLTRKELRVDNGLGECQIACVNSRHFTCRSFVFRYESDRDQEPNCFLSDCPTSEIILEENPGLSRVDQAELYERGSYGRGCEPYPFATIYNSAYFDKTKPPNGGNNQMGNRGDEGCYSSYQGGCRFSPYAVSAITRVDSENECRKKCSRMRNNPHSPCMSYSFKIGDEKRGDNCYLSDVPRRDLRPGLDYVYDDDYVMYAWKELEPQCSLGPLGYPHNGGFHQDSAGVIPGSWSNDASSNGKPPPLGPGTGLLSYNNLVLGIRPLDSDKPDPLNPPDYSTTPQNVDGYSSGFGSLYPDGFASFNRHYTVNGLPCKRDTKCERNELVGFWSCEPEGSELGSWDYCCEPNHHCGFSQGYRYPWCYVGPSEDQWRPCSDKYFPYLPSPRPAVRPNQHDDRRPSYQHPSQTIDNEESTSYHSRHWPIAFLHPQPPPNATDSVALADDRCDDSQLTTNTSKQQSTTDKTLAPSTETSNSPITRIQLHKSHLKRRGLVTANRTNIQTKNSTKKIRRITIIPTDENADFATHMPPYGAKYNYDKPSNSRDSGYYNNTKTTRKNDGFEVIRLGATLQEVESAKKQKGNLGRVERVMKPTRNSSIDFKTRRNKDGTQQENFSKKFDVVSSPTDTIPVYVPVTLMLHPSNDSNRGV